MAITHLETPPESFDQEMKKVEKRPLGQSGLEISIIGLGTWAMGATFETWGQVDDRESIAAIHQALDCGINFIDTAPIYGLGHSEETVGNAIHGRRSEVILATKCGQLFPQNKNELPPRSLKKDSIIKQCEDSLRRLRTDVIDLYQCHWPDPDTPMRETMEAMTKLLEQGKIRAIGVSNFSCDQMAAAREFGPVHCLQPPFSMLHLRALDELIPFCQEHQMGVIPYSPLAKGLLTGKFDPSSTFSDIRSRDPEFMGNRYQRNLSLVDGLKSIANGYNKSVSQLVINWTTSQPGITAPIIGAKRPSQVTENVGGVGWTIRDEDRTRIESLLRGNVRET